jgi:hypothetical protein
LLVALTALTGTVLIWRKNSAWRLTLYLSLLFAALFLFNIFLTSTHDSLGVVSAKESQVFSTPGKDRILLFTLHEGTELEILEKQEQWALVELAGGKKGWALKEGLILE